MKRIGITAGCIVIVLACTAQVRLRFIPAGGGASGLITISNITCEAKFRIQTPLQGHSVWDGGGLQARMRYDTGDGTRHYFTYTSGGNVFENVEPAVMSSCGTANDATVIAAPAAWGLGPSGDPHGSDWGRFPFQSDGSDDGLPGDPTSSTAYSGMKWDKLTSKWLSFWEETYGGDGDLGKPAFGASTMDFSTHTFIPYGCWTTNPSLPQQQLGTAAMQPPASWISTNSALLPAGSNFWILGFGGPIGVTTAVSMGPSVFLTSVPGSGNSCTSNVSYPTPTGKILSNYQPNPDATMTPNCWLSGVLGCTPTGTPVHTYPAQNSFTGYSSAIWPQDWVPYGGHGWDWTGSAFGMDWYDDGVFHGVVKPYSIASGWATGTTPASPAPTYNAGTHLVTWGTSSIDTHDGYTINPGDGIWWQACTAGVDPGCSNANGLDQACGSIDSISGTGPYVITAVAFAICGDSGGLFKPVVGGHWQFGANYAHAAVFTFLPRTANRMQIINPDEYVKVLNGTYSTPDLPVAAEDADATNIFAGMGGPSTGSGVVVSNPGNVWQVPVVTEDAAHRRIIVSFGNAPCPSNSYNCAMVYVLKVQ